MNEFMHICCKEQTKTKSNSLWHLIKTREHESHLKIFVEWTKNFGSNNSMIDHSNIYIAMVWYISTIGNFPYLSGHY